MGLIAPRSIEHNVGRATRCGLEESGIRFVDDHRTHIGPIGEIIKAGIFAEMPASRFLLETGSQVGHPEAGGGIGITIIDIDFCASQGLQGG